MGTIYETVITELAPHLTTPERNLLHVVHQSLAVGDAILANYSEEVLQIVAARRRGDTAENPWETYPTRLREMIVSYHVVEELIQSYLSGSPIDVFASRDALPVRTL